MRWIGDIPHLEPDELVVKSPLDVKGIIRRPRSYGTHHGPCAGQVLEQRVLKAALGSIQRRLGLLTYRWSS